MRSSLDSWLPPWKVPAAISMDKAPPFTNSIIVDAFRTQVEDKRNFILIVLNEEELSALQLATSRFLPSQGRLNHQRATRKRTPFSGFLIVMRRWKSSLKESTRIYLFFLTPIFSLIESRYTPRTPIMHSEIQINVNGLPLRRWTSNVISVSSGFLLRKPASYISIRITVALCSLKLAPRSTVRK